MITCPRCTYDNPPNSTVCTVCQGPLPGGGGRAGGIELSDMNTGTAGGGRGRFKVRQVDMGSPRVVQERPSPPPRSGGGGGCCIPCCDTSDGEELCEQEKSVVYGLGGCCCCAFFTLLTIILIATSIRDVDYGMYGIEYNRLTCELNTNVYDEGKHLLKPESQMFTYNGLTISFDFSDSTMLYCVTYDGIEIILDLQVQYKLKKEEIIDIVLEWGEEDLLTDYLKSVTADSVRDMAAQYTAQDFYEDRGGIEQEMETHLTSSMERANAHIDVGLLQVRNVHLPNELMSAIEDKQRAELDIQNAESERDGAVTAADTAKITVEIEADTQIAVANATARAIITEATETATAVEQAQRKRYEVWGNIMSESGLTATQFVQEYLKAVVIQTVENPLLSIRRIEAGEEVLPLLDDEDLEEFEDELPAVVE